MDSFDAPMLDYSGDSDVHMHTTVSSPKPWPQSETIMEEDVHPVHFPNPFPSHPPQQDVEIDMDDYYNENVEYEMADGEVEAPDTELVDVDVYDAPREDAFLASAPVAHSTNLTTQNPEPRKSAENHFSPSDIGVSTDHIPAVSDPEPLLPKSAEPERLTPTLPQEAVVQDRDIDSSHDTAAVTLQTDAPPLQVVLEDPRSGGGASAAFEGHADLSAGVDSTSHKVDASQPLDDSEQKNGPESSTTERESSASVLQDVTPRPVVEEPPHQAETQEDESDEGVRVHHESHENSVPEPALDSTETGEPPRGIAESHEAKGGDNDDPHEISEGVYIEPPPPVLIELPSSLDQSICTLFNTPAHLPSDDTEGNASSTAASYIVLLQNRPTLYYETLNDVFDALREEERIQSMTEFIDGEMVLDAHDLQLVVSEVIFTHLMSVFCAYSHKKDNVHAREISLHDLNVLHDGLGLTGPLRLQLRTVLSRFICRYRSLQSQVTRFRVSETTNHPTDDSNENERAYVGPREFIVGPSRGYGVNILSAPETDSGYYQALNDDRQTKREPTNDGDPEGLSKGNLDEPEDVESTDYAHAEYQDEHEEETYDESEQYADAREYLQAVEEEANTHEETDQLVANDESEFVLDADPTYEGSTGPETTEYQERDEEHGEDGVSADVEVPNTTAAFTHTKENVLSSTKLGVLTEVPESAATGEHPQPEDSEGKLVNALRLPC
jgi:hypothetical protein